MRCKAFSSPQRLMTRGELSIEVDSKIGRRKKTRAVVGADRESAPKNSLSGGE
jgi:hypothetical protein